MKVSIITVSRNSVNTIEQTIVSVLEQSYKNIEYIIIDGQSTDGTVDIIKKYMNFISYFVSEPDNGLYEAMNKGISRATGDVIGIINSDDWYEKHAVEKVVGCLKKKGAELVYGKNWLIDKKGERRCQNSQPLKYIWHTPVVPHPTVFIRREIYEKYGAFNENYKIAADYDLLLRFYVKGVKFEYIDEMISNFRCGGVSDKNYMQSYKEAREVSLSYIEECPEKEQTLKKIEKNYNLSWLMFTVGKDHSVLDTFLKKKYPDVKEGIVIFGLGIWGERIYYALNDRNILVKMFVDNDEKKWNTEWKGVMIQCPEVLRNYKGYVVIAVKNEAEEICKQLLNMGNSEMQWITLNEICQGLQLGVELSCQ